MPPRIPSAASPAVSTVRASAWPGTTASANQHITPPCHHIAGFSTTASRPRFTKTRRMFRSWIAGPGAVFKNHTPDSGPNYLKALTPGTSYGHHPFPINPSFRSHPVLDEKARETVWHKVMQEGEPIKAVSAEFGIDINRVAAIVRLKEVEKDWVAKKKKLARPYAKAVLSMLPTRSLGSRFQNEPFEPINELHVHPYTMQQIYWPTSESRHFTREDAAKAFHKDMLSADKRVPHPELIEMERELLNSASPHEAAERFKEAVTRSEQEAANKQIEKAQTEEDYTTRVSKGRFEFRFKQYNSDNVGPKGKNRHTVGWRYGAPYYDRSKDHQIKIPTSVP
ncbi:eukaryotic mitochondrial regulator protein-domain-containing protein [Biscogniauxia sp. FL1348]|nr:eukaryotic mitochondrial regulator protein-domain-containing protein [Biscogniauxia sp. FL1348]